MLEEIKITRSSAEELKTEGVVDVGIGSAVDIQSWLDSHPRETLTSYGHGVGMLGQAIFNTASVFKDQQLAYLKQAAEGLIEKYGPHIIDFMRPELKEALGIVSTKAPVAE